MEPSREVESSQHRGLGSPSLALEESKDGIVPTNPVPNFSWLDHSWSPEPFGSPGTDKATAPVPDFFGRREANKDTASALDAFGRLKSTEATVPAHPRTLS